MSRHQASWIAASVTIVAACLALIHVTSAQTQDAPASKPSAGASQFEFDVIESFNAKYQGDSPGHIGRGGKLEGQRPNVALGDGVYHGEKRIGVVTNVSWDRARGSMDIEFTAEPHIRVAVGDSVWLYLDGEKARAESQ